jgi:hypothetical protein
MLYGLFEHCLDWITFFVQCHRIVESGEACPMCCKAVSVDQLRRVADVKSYLYHQGED